MNTSLMMLSAEAVLLGGPRGMALRHGEQIRAGVGHLWSDLHVLHQPLSLSLVKCHAPIKRLQFQLFSSHVILWFDYKPCLPPLSCIPSCGPHALASSVCVHSVQVQLKVTFSVICHMQPFDLTQLGLIKSPLSSMAGGFSYAVQTISTTNWRWFNLGIAWTTVMEMLSFLINLNL